MEVVSKTPDKMTWYDCALVPRGNTLGKAVLQVLTCVRRYRDEADIRLDVESGGLEEGREFVLDFVVAFL